MMKSTSVQVRSMLCCALVAIILSGCNTSQVDSATKGQATALAKAAFIKAANFRCRTVKTQVALARSVADSLGATDAAKAKAEEVRKQTDDLRAQLSALGGPSSVAGPVKDALKVAAGIPAQVSDGQLTPEAGKARLEEIHSPAT